MTMEKFTENGIGRYEYLPEMEIADLKAKIGMLEKANEIMREALYSSLSVMKEARKAEATLLAIGASKSLDLVEQAVKASHALEDMISAQDAFMQSKKI